MKFYVVRFWGRKSLHEEKISDWTLIREVESSQDITVSWDVCDIRSEIEKNEGLEDYDYIEEEYIDEDGWPITVFSEWAEALTEKEYYRLIQ